MFGRNKNNVTNDDMPAARLQNGFLQATKYLNTHLNKGEAPLFRAHLSWIPVFTRQIPFMLIGSIIGGAVWGITGNFFIGCLIPLIACIAGVLSQVGQIYRNIATDILLTDQGIHSKYKLFAVEDDQFTRYGYINDASLSYNSVFQRLFQYGDVEIETIGQENYTFRGLAKPMAFKQAVRAAQNRYANGGTRDNQDERRRHNDSDVVRMRKRSPRRKRSEGRNDDSTAPRQQRRRSNTIR